jgi:hypothetical protein
MLSIRCDSLETWIIPRSKKRSKGGDVGRDGCVSIHMTRENQFISRSLMQDIYETLKLTLTI